MTFIPKVKTIVGGTVPGKLVDEKTGRQYLGEFIQDYKGNFYKGTSITKSSEKLILQTPEEKSNDVEGLRFIYTKPTQKDYDNGIFKRYFVKDKTTGKVVEVNRKKYVEYKKLKKPYYTPLQLDWVISSPKKDYYLNNILVLGAESKNKKLINQAEKSIPGIEEQVLKDLGEFVK